MALVSSPLLAGSTAYADQGAYGEVIAWADGSNDCFVQNAVVVVRNSLGQYVTQTTASICGYYTISLSPGIYHLIVDGTYNARDRDNCGNIISYNESIAGDAWVTIISGFWNREDIDNCL